MICVHISGTECRCRPDVTGAPDAERCIRASASHLIGLAMPGLIPPGPDPATLDRVASCPLRGTTLPISLQPDCDCRGKELTECRLGKGRVPGRVTLRDCLACVGG